MRKRLGSLVVVALLLAVTGGSAWASHGDDPLRTIPIAGLLPYFNVGSGNLTFLLLASPNGDNSGTPSSHLFFYSAACARQESIFVPQTDNDTDAILLNGKTSLTEGAVLISGTNDGTDQVALNNPIIARGVWLDINADHGRLLDPARTDGGTPWSPYDEASAFIFAPPDDGVSFFDRVIFSCPVGTAVNTLATDMDNLDSTFPRPATSVTLQAVVFDDDENPLVDWTTTCTCVKSPTRLSALNPVYATTNTYTEIFSPGTDGFATNLRHMGYMNIEAHNGATDVDLFGRLHRDDDTDF